MSASHNRFGPSAVKSRWTRSSWTGGPGLPLLRRRFLLSALHHRMLQRANQ
jgi:hypothetical protein